MGFEVLIQFYPAVPRRVPCARGRRPALRDLKSHRRYLQSVRSFEVVENETVVTWSPAEGAGAGAGQQADTQEARGGIQGEGGTGAIRGEPTNRRGGERIWSSPEPGKK